MGRMEAAFLLPVLRTARGCVRTLIIALCAGGPSPLVCRGSPHSSSRPKESKSVRVSVGHRTVLKRREPLTHCATWLHPSRYFKSSNRTFVAQVIINILPTKTPLGLVQLGCQLSFRCNTKLTNACTIINTHVPYISNESRLDWHRTR